MRKTKKEQEVKQEENVMIGIVTHPEAINFKYSDYDRVEFQFKNNNKKGETIFVFLERVYHDNMFTFYTDVTTIINGRRCHGYYNPMEVLVEYIDKDGNIKDVRYDITSRLVPFSKENINKFVDEVYQRAFITFHDIDRERKIVE